MATTQTIVRSATTSSRRRAPTLRAGVWLLPPVLYFLMLFAFPLVNLIRMGFAKPIPGQVTGTGVSLANYKSMFADPFFLQVLVETLKIGVLVTLLALVLGYPLAYFLARTHSRWKGLLLVMTLSPILVSIVVRSYGWLVLLADKGLVNSILMDLHIIQHPIKLIFNETGVVIGTAHVLLPFMVLAILSSLQSLDPQLEEAASTLGAHRWQVFRDVIWPLSLPGVTAGILIVFVLAAGSFVTTMLLGGQVVLTIPILAYQQFGVAFNWPFGSALASLLLVSVMVLTFSYDLFLQPRLLKGVRRT